jgi:NAD(P)-dependent dehydrogenase (short-subunit alcohol dehydrogenase family)
MDKVAVITAASDGIAEAAVTMASRRLTAVDTALTNAWLARTG